MKSVSRSKNSSYVPTYDELSPEFTFAVNCGLFKRKRRHSGWQPHDSCKGVDLADPSVCQLMPCPEGKTALHVVGDLGWHNLRPATLMELILFVRRYPDEPRRGCIVALGVACLWKDAIYVPYVEWRGDRKRSGSDLFMAYNSIHCLWDKGASRFLVAPK